jgi:hypothetical protein
VAGCYIPFTDIGTAVMKMLADTQGIKIDEPEKVEIPSAWQRATARAGAAAQASMLHL